MKSRVFVFSVCDTFMLQHNAVERAYSRMFTGELDEKSRDFDFCACVDLVVCRDVMY